MCSANDITKSEALDLARTLVASRIVLRPCADPPPTLFGFDSGAEFLFSVEESGVNSRVGASEYIAVSRQNGKARSLGFHGE